MPHTPGPWTVVEDCGMYDVDCRTMNVCQVSRHNPYAESDAALIAAAPELLAALRDCVESLSRLPDASGAFRITCIVQAKDALAKAEGR